MSAEQIVAESGRPRTDHEPMQGGDLPLPGQTKSLSVSEAAAVLAQRRHDAEPPGSVPAEQPEPADVAPEEEIALDDEQPVEDSDVDDGQSEGEASEGEEGLLEESEDSEGEAEEQTEEEEEGPLELAEEDVILIDGKEMSLQDIRDNTLAQDDYTRKTQALSEQRDVLTEREQLVGIRLGQMEGFFTQGVERFNQVDWATLAEQDPERYRAMRAQQDAANMQLQQVRQETERFFAEIKEADDKAQKAAAARAATELKRDIPGWNNGMYYSLVDYAESEGFDRGEVLKYVDPNVFKLLRKAKLYDDAQKSAKKTKKVVRASAKKTIRAKAPTGRARPSKEKQAEASAAKRLQESGKMDDAVALLQSRRRAQG